jgi:hypothetical protein
MKPALIGPASQFERRVGPFGAARSERTECDKKKPARWGRAGFVLLGEEVLL